MVARLAEDFTTALVLVAHPDDPEYGMAAAVARWTAQGKRVVYALATSGEEGIEGMAPSEAGPLREGEQIASAAAVGVSEVEFWGFPDSQLSNSAELRAKVTECIERIAPEIVLSLYGGPEWGPGLPNQRDHIEFAAAVADAFDAIDGGPSALYTNGPGPTHAVDVTGYTDAAIEALECHRVYLEVLDPSTPVIDQATAQVDRSTGPIPGFPADRASGFRLVGSR